MGRYGAGDGGRRLAGGSAARCMAGWAPPAAEAGMALGRRMPGCLPADEPGCESCHLRGWLNSCTVSDAKDNRAHFDALPGVQPPKSLEEEAHGDSKAAPTPFPIDSSSRLQTPNANLFAALCLLHSASGDCIGHLGCIRSHLKAWLSERPSPCEQVVQPPWQDRARQTDCC